MIFLLGFAGVGSLLGLIARASRPFFLLFAALIAALAVVGPGPLLLTMFVKEWIAFSIAYFLVGGLRRRDLVA